MNEPQTQRAFDKSTVRTAGRGAMAIATAKVWFLITGWVAMIALPRIFKWATGSAEAGQALFGDYKLVFMGVSFINNAIVTGTIQAVSKFTSEAESRARAVRSTALRVQAVIGIGLAVLYALAAPWLAGWLGSPSLTVLMRLSAGVIAAYSFYAVYIGSFNGQQQFGRQAGFDIAYSTLRTTLILALAAAGLEVAGAVLGFLIAAVLIAALAAVSSRGLPPSAQPLSARKYVGFAAALFLYTLLLNLVMSLDLFLLKGQAAQIMTPQASSVVAGLYGAAQNLAFIPYQAVLAIAFVAFPMISRVTFDNDSAKAKAYVHKTMRLCAILSMGLATVFIALPHQSLSIIYPAEYTKAAPTLAVLSVGLMCFALLSVANALLNGAGNERRTLAVILATLAAVVGAVQVLLSTTKDGTDLPLRAAIGTATGMGVGLIISLFAIRRRFGAAIAPWTAVRVLMAGAAAVGLGQLMPMGGKLLSLAECGAIVVSYFAVLIASREIGRDDYEQLKVVFK
ncbi:MAG: oligosaccharide flippase family protein [Myxococcota bacterium]|jgi:stage V sporulation protein B|nr:oligosaccharide flippase family protein [Myxococcota bacterium]